MSKKKALMVLAGTLIAAGTVAAISQPGPHRHRGSDRMHGDWGSHFGGMQRGKNPIMRLKALDTDKDGSVTLAEFTAPQEKRFTALDTNNDGGIDATEASARVRDRIEFRFKRFTHRLDRDKDGKITTDEFRRSARERFAMRDLDDDGRITAADMPPWMRDRMAEWKSRRGGMGPGKAPEDKAPDGKAPDAKAADDKATDGKGSAEGRRGRGGPFTMERAMAGRDAAFKGYDRNGDGVIDKAEIDAAVTERVDYWARRFVHRYDQNKDGKVTKDEFLRFARERFAALDLNDDGKLTEDDLPPWMRGRNILK